MTNDTRTKDTAAAVADDRAAFFLTLFAEMPPTSRVELRLFLDGVKGKAPLGRYWYSTVVDLLAALPKIAADAQAKGAGVFFGVLPRKDETSGENHNTISWHTVWSDMDFKDYKGGEAEARERISKFPIKPTIIVRTGHGFHLYWLLREDEEPMRLTAINTGIRDVLESDNVQDAARVLRVPGTYNVKNPAAPVPCEIESIDPHWQVNATDFDDVMPLAGEPVENRNEKTAPGERPAGIAERISDRVLGLFDKYPKLQKLFEGTGKPATGDDGKPMDTSSSGYDFSVVLGLAGRGITDELELATVLWHRNDDAARSKGMRYIRRTVRNAIAKAAVRGTKSARFVAPFVIERVRCYLTDPARFEFTITGISFCISAAELLKPDKFATAYTNATQRVMAAPSAQEWADYLAPLLEQAERIEMAPETTRDGALRQAIERAVLDFGAGLEVEDLDRSKILDHNGRKLFKAEPLYRHIVQDVGPVEKPDFYRVLHEMRFVNDNFTIAGKSVRAWFQAGEARP